METRSIPIIICKLFSIIIFSVSLFTILPHCASANPFFNFKEKQSLKLVYDIYSSGFKIASQSISISKINNQIYIQNKTLTTGAANFIEHIEIDVEVIESITKDKNIPITFRAQSENGLIFIKKSKNYVNYKNNHVVDSFDFIAIEEVEKEDFPQKYLHDDISPSTNWMSFITMIANHFKKDPLSCKLKATIFDVTSANKVMLSSPKKINFSESAYTKYIGPAIRCKMTLSPIAPIDTPKKQTLIKTSISIAEIMEGFFLPVTLTIKNEDDLTIISHLVDYNMTTLSDFTPLKLIPDIPIPTPDVK